MTSGVISIPAHRRWRAAVALLCIGLVLAPTIGAAQVAAAGAASAAGMPGSLPGAADDAPGFAASAPPPATSRVVDEIRSDPASGGDTAATPLARDPSSPAPDPRAAAAGSAATRAQPTTDFQQFAATSVGRLLPVFGRDLFSTAPSTFAPVADLPPSSDYIVGPGDELLIRGWGQVNVDVRTTVTRDGTIHIPRVGVVPVAGVRFSELSAHVKRAVGRYYRNFELSASLGRLRSIQVFVVGHAHQPGLYTVSSISTLVNALLAAGGPSATGSMRAIELRRGGRTVGALDLYDILLRGDKSSDLRLQPGDVIFIPPVGPVAAVAGPVKMPAIYELKAFGTSLDELLGYAGGLTTTASTRSVLLERLDARRGRMDEELPWDDATRARPLRDGDILMIRRVSTRFFNAVTLRGSVVAPFRTEWRPGLRVADLIPESSALISGGYWARAASRAYPAAAPGARSEAGDASAHAQQRVRTEVENLVDEVNWDYAVIERLDRDRLTPRLVPFNLAKAILDHDPEHDLPLEPGDIVTVFSQTDMPIPAERRSSFVRIEGEVRTPGVYQVHPGEDLRTVVRRAGGLTPHAYLFGAEFMRESVRREQQARLDEVATRAEDDLSRAAKQQLARALTPEDTAAVKGQIEAQQRTIARLRGIRATGRMVLEIRAEAASLDDVPAIALEDGDRLYVPMQSSSVGVYGAVYNASNFLYRSGKHLDDYLRMAGGPTRTADTRSIYLLRADGSVRAKTQEGWFSSYGRTVVMPSEAIVVPEEFAPTSWVKELKDWSQILFNFGLAAAAVKVLTQ